LCCNGCSNPQTIAELKPREVVLDLGSGGGYDCLLATRQVRGNGNVIEVDMTPEMASCAHNNAVKNRVHEAFHVLRPSEVVVWPFSMS